MIYRIRKHYVALTVFVILGSIVLTLYYLRDGSSLQKPLEKTFAVVKPEITFFSMTSTSPYSSSISSTSSTSATPRPQKSIDFRSSECKIPSEKVSSIPKIIHQMYDSALIPTEFKKYVLSWLKIYPNFTYMFWRDSDIAAFIKEHYPTNWSDIYHKELATGVERADIARILILNHFGGIYTDLDVMAVRPIGAMLDDYGLVIATEPAHHSYFLFNKDILPSNAIVMSIPFHKFWCFIFHNFPQRLITKYSHLFKIRKIERNRAVSATGPVMITEMLDRYKKVNKNCAENERICQIHLASWRELQPKYDESESVKKKLKGLCRKFLAEQTNKYKESSLNSKKWHLCRNLKERDYKSKIFNISVTYHDFLHLTYYKEKLKTEKVSVLQLAPNAVFYLNTRMNNSRPVNAPETVGLAKT